MMTMTPSPGSLPTPWPTAGPTLCAPTAWAPSPAPVRGDTRASWPTRAALTSTSAPTPAGTTMWGQYKVILHKTSIYSQPERGIILVILPLFWPDLTAEVTPTVLTSQAGPRMAPTPAPATLAMSAGPPDQVTKAIFGSS